MEKWDKFRARLIGGQSDANIEFADLIGYVKRVGFEERINGSHHVLYREGLEEIFNLPPLPNGKAKIYQARQARSVVVGYLLTEGCVANSGQIGLVLHDGINSFAVEPSAVWPSDTNSRL